MAHFRCHRTAFALSAPENNYQAHAYEARKIRQGRPWRLADAPVVPALADLSAIARTVPTIRVSINLWESPIARRKTACPERSKHGRRADYCPLAVTAYRLRGSRQLTQQYGAPVAAAPTKQAQPESAASLLVNG